MQIPVELSITRLGNDESHPIRIEIKNLGSPNERFVAQVSLDHFALAITGRGAVDAVLTKHRFPIPPALTAPSPSDRA